MKKQWITGLSALALLGGMLAGCSSGTSPQQEGGNQAAGANVSSEAKGDAEKIGSKFITIATGGASGPYNVIGSALSNIYFKQYGVNSKTQTTGASVENINLLKQGKTEMAFVMSDVLSDAINGEGSFNEKADNINQVAALYPNYVQVITTNSTGIQTFTDLKGKRVAVGAQNSGVEVNARNLLKAHGISYSDLKIDYLGYAEAADALKAGKLDAAFLTSGIPNSSLLELAQSVDMRIVPIEGEAIDKLAEEVPYFIKGTIPKDTYKNETDIPTAAIMNDLVVRSDLQENDVYLLTKTFFESLDDLVNAHQAAKDISFSEAAHGNVAPIHPGAQKYYDEKK